ncbi:MULTISPECIES: DUF397 domain-containing protein [unclassified Saccharopolyspora]|uniref:DUF397 domain-containing protein n=1 Tax=unclassified Saccharopolyspora TaxID=2646250 RepID=UPI001CD49D46|nr:MULTISPECIES: DUF397 domain-containing protein [unclassified Saccharopolyspora]MCA1186902.1 DUF397 domain-containing protein [Saccharopolyspora sp. 6T]MCA1193335.1 DUF397 domain-containing protein [Saccharopolyspora sp. 6V]MCA1228044.1 DUF397 domain-containing protein [Saccharopolyspora sp. 6M]MCA1281386.1 DUF397 domain-containing protein [Saccharopolyspora sp. 7B]
MPERNLIGATWFKSSYSNSQNECVEVALTSGSTGVRDTKDRDGGTLIFTSTTWSAFLRTLKA